MRCDSFLGYAAETLDWDKAAGRVSLRSDYCMTSDRVRLHVLSGGRCGRAGRDGLIRDLDGHVLASGAMDVIAGVVLRHPDGWDIETIRVEIGGRVVAVLTTEPLEPDTSYVRRAAAGEDDRVGSGPHGFPVAETEGAPRSAFPPGTRIATGRGEIPVQWLRPGDVVETRKDGPQPVIWVGRHASAPRAFVRFAPGSLADRAPLRSLNLPEDHRVTVDGPAISLLYGLPAALVPTAGLTHWPGVSRHGRGVGEWYQFRLPRHCEIRAEGAWVENARPEADPARTLLMAAVSPTDGTLASGAFAPCHPVLGRSETRAIPPRPARSRQANGGW